MSRNRNDDDYSVRDEDRSASLFDPEDNGDVEDCEDVDCEFESPRDVFGDDADFGDSRVVYNLGDDTEDDGEAEYAEEDVSEIVDTEPEFGRLTGLPVNAAVSRTASAR